jgi:hypothetical protein
MDKKYTVAIISGLAVGLFVGYEFDSWQSTYSLSNIWPWSMVASYVNSKVA